MSPSTGTLFIISTPIGNLDDLSPRAAKTLGFVKYILCESTSHTSILFSSLRATGGSVAIPKIAASSRHGVGTPRNDMTNRAMDWKNAIDKNIKPTLIRYEGKGPKSDWQIQKVIADLQNGDSVALVSNAGTPLISDPGAKLVSAVVRAGLPVIHVPGPAAFVSAAVTSGLPTKNILFIGFLPKKTKALTQKLAAARSSLLTLDEPASLVCYVSKYQLNKIMAAVTEVFGGQIIVNIARELTKLHEDHFTGPISELKPWLSASPHRSKGEFTLVISPS